MRLFCGANLLYVGWLFLHRGMVPYMSTIGGILFALGMCMVLPPEWGALTQGIVIGMAVYMIWRANKNLKKLRFQEPQT